jgi:hypothetical protein
LGISRRAVRAVRLGEARALVAQRIEHLTTDQKVGGSNPSERANESPGQGPYLGFIGSWLLGANPSGTPRPVSVQLQ